MTSPMVMTIQLSQEDFELLQNVARFRADLLDPEAPVDLTAYVRQLFNEDRDRCLQQIEQKRSV